MAPHALGEPSPWVTRWSHLIAPGGSVLDVACGRGRHVRWLATKGFRMTGVDRDATALAELQGRGRLVEADIENGPWPLPGETFDAIVVTNYLWRPLLPTLRAALAPGGVLIYETFAQGNEVHGKPSNPNFLLQPGELLAFAQGLPHGMHIVAYEDGVLNNPTRRVQRIAALAPPRSGQDGAL
jgi:SAM-dependent methyltransferase